MERALIIVDHGSSLPAAHDHLEWIAEQVRLRDPTLCVQIAHMDIAHPTIEEAVNACVSHGARELAVHPLFLSPGTHLTRDVPEQLRLAEEKHPGIRVRMLEPLGSNAEIADLILGSLRHSN